MQKSCPLDYLLSSLIFFGSIFFAFSTSTGLIFSAFRASTVVLTVNFKDLAGNKNSYTFAVDATPNRVTQTFYRGSEVEGLKYYLTNGNKLQFNIGFRELLAEPAKVTIGGKEVELTYLNYNKPTNSHMYYGYLEVAEDETELVEGELEISISNITDEVGNPGFYYQTNGKKVYETPSLNEIRDYCLNQVNRLWDEVKRFENPHNYYVDLSQKLWDVKHNLLEKNKKF